MKKTALLLICISLMLSMASCEFTGKPGADGSDIPSTEDSITKDASKTEDSATNDSIVKDDSSEDEDKVTTSEPTEGIKYELSSDGSFATVVGYEGTATDIHFLKEYEGAPVTKIGANAFKENKDITSVTIHNGIKEIEGWAFFECSSLTSLKFENGSTLTIIHQYVFQSTALSKLVIPESVTHIGALAFAGCLSLNSITIPSTTLIGDNAFQNTGYFNNENNWENGVLYIGTHLINVKLEYEGEVVVREGTTTIAGSAFSYRQDVTRVVMPDSVVSISEMAFYYCTDLEEVVLSKNLAYIGFEAFYHSYIHGDFIIPKSVKTIEASAFRYAVVNRVFYEGTKDDWNNIAMGNYNDVFKNNEEIGWFYYYSESSPEEPRKYWHYDENGNIVIWK